MLVEPGNASAGAPSSTRPAARTPRYPNRATSLGVTSSVSTVDAISAPVARPSSTLIPDLHLLSS